MRADTSRQGGAGACVLRPALAVAYRGVRTASFQRLGQHTTREATANGASARRHHHRPVATAVACLRRTPTAAPGSRWRDLQANRAVPGGPAVRVCGRRPHSRSPRCRCVDVVLKPRCSREALRDREGGPENAHPGRRPSHGAARACQSLASPPYRRRSRTSATGRDHLHGGCLILSTRSQPSKPNSRLGVSHNTARRASACGSRCSATPATGRSQPARAPEGTASPRPKPRPAACRPRPALAHTARRPDAGAATPNT